MNQRILELWAGAHKLTKDAMDDVPRRNYNDVLMEEFAKLIAKDCMDLCRNRAQSGTQGSFNDAALLCREDIKRQYGVEQ